LMTLAQRAAVDGQGSQRVAQALQRVIAMPARQPAAESTPEEPSDERKPLGPTHVTA